MPAARRPHGKPPEFVGQHQLFGRHAIEEPFREVEVTVTVGVTEDDEVWAELFEGGWVKLPGVAVTVEVEVEGAEATDGS
jgi:hypothetical protein